MSTNRTNELGNAMREIHMAHAQYVRELKDAHARRFEN